MADDFLAIFIGNTARARIVRAIVFNESEPLTLSQMAKRSGMSPRVVQREVRVLEALGIIRKAKSAPAPKRAWKLSKRKVKKTAAKKTESAWGLNPDFKYARALSMFVHEVSPLRYDKIVAALKRTGKISLIIVSGAFMGDSSRPADLLVAGDGLSEPRVEQAVRVLEPHFGREIRYAILSTAEFRYRLTVQDRLIRETLDYPHLVLLDKGKLL